MAAIEKEVKQAQVLTEAVRDKTLSKRQKVKGIRDNRAFEKQKRREQEAFELDRNELSNQVEPEPIAEVEQVQPKITSDKTESDKSLKLRSCTKKN
jgi:hypothetical protein